MESCKAVLRSLIERGLRNVMIVIHDDFPGLLNVTQGLFPQADVQLCIVHMQRNARSHLGKAQAAEFNSRMRTIKGAWSPERAAAEFDDLCKQFTDHAPAFVAEQVSPSPRARRPAARVAAVRDRTGAGDHDDARPIAGATPSVDSSPAVIVAASRRSGSPAPVRFTVVTAYASMAEKARLISRQSR